MDPVRFVGSMGFVDPVNPMDSVHSRGGAIRKGRVNDQGALSALAAVCEGVPRWSEAVWEQVLRSAEGPKPLRAVLVAVTGQGIDESVGIAGIAGFGVISLLADGAEIENLAVLPSARRGGFGTLLCRALLQAALEAGAARVRLEVRSGNAGALILYERLGFAEEGKRRSYYREPEEDAVLMSRALR